MIFSPRHSIFVCTLLLGACMSHDASRVPVTLMGTSGMGAVDQMSARAGDTPEKLAAQTHLDIASLIQMNGLTPAQKLTPGQKLSVPTPPQITVIEGDTIISIARAFDLKPDDIAAENGLKKPYMLVRGQILKMPQKNSDQQNSAPPIMDAYDSQFASNDLGVASAPVDPMMGNANTPMTTTESATGTKIHASANGVIMEDELAPIPGSAPAPAAAPQAMTAPSLAPSTTPLNPPAAQPMALSKPTAPPLPATGTPTFSWPVNGSVLSGYGPKSGGVKNEGMNIGAPSGTSVRAAAPGEVVYTGDNVAGFGNLILIRHQGGYATAYAHVQNPLVKRGDRIEAGQAIAQVGKTGNVSTPQLHFEVRKGTQPVNPETYLP